MNAQSAVAVAGSFRLRHLLVPLVITLVPLGLAAAGTPATSRMRRAVWAEHDLTIELEHLPKAYSCNDLTQKIHDVLHAIGARPDIRIFVSRCEDGVDTRLVAPRAHVIFSIPFEVDGQLADFFDTLAIERTVRVEAGDPASIDFSDCELLRQLRLTLLDSVSMSVQPSHLVCGSTAPRQTPFSLSIEALVPAPAPLRATTAH
jgi:hypothetical protein